MQMKALRSFAGREGRVRAGSTINVGDQRRAELLEKRGLAMPIGKAGAPAPRKRGKEGKHPLDKLAAENAGKRSARSGTRTGAAASPSSAAPARQRKSRGSSKSAPPAEG